MSDASDERDIRSLAPAAHDPSASGGEPGSPGVRDEPGAPEDSAIEAPADNEVDEHESDDVTTAQRVVRRAVDGASDVVDTVGNAGRTVGQLAGPVVRRVRPRVGAAYRRWKNRQAARVARLHALNREPLPNLYEVHPEARLASIRELGLQTIPVAEIVGTAVEGSVQRGRDFLPPPPLRTSNWVARWQRILKATESLAVLPPIDAVKAAGVFWVVDGHNRVGAALYTNQVAIDALVSAVRLPGDPIEIPGSLASMLSREDELDGVGRFVARHTYEPSPTDAERAASEQRVIESAPEGAPGAVGSQDGDAESGGPAPDGGAPADAAPDPGRGEGEDAVPAPFRGDADDEAPARDRGPADPRGAEDA